jgi:hypothetical protein
MTAPKPENVTNSLQMGPAQKPLDALEVMAALKKAGWTHQTDGSGFHFTDPTGQNCRSYIKRQNVWVDYPANAKHMVPGVSNGVEGRVDRAV